ncbi:hypothetical protein C8R47DRAFT_1157830 [Mycena vitilis]|nr:hypothetical protein C8R47DRAFT_1157830 [Mycena vitilis]
MTRNRIYILSLAVLSRCNHRPGHCCNRNGVQMYRVLPRPRHHRFEERLSAARPPLLRSVRRLYTAMQRSCWCWRSPCSVHSARTRADHLPPSGPSRSKRAPLNPRGSRAHRRHTCSSPRPPCTEKSPASLCPPMPSRSSGPQTTSARCSGPSSRTSLVPGFTSFKDSLFWEIELGCGRCSLELRKDRRWGLMHGPGCRCVFCHSKSIADSRELDSEKV